MKFEWKVKDWKKWLVIAAAAFIGACIHNFIHPLQPGGLLSPAEARSFVTQIGGVVGLTIAWFVLGGVFAIPYKGIKGAIVGVVVVAILLGLSFYVDSLDEAIRNSHSN